MDRSDEAIKSEFSKKERRCRDFFIEFMFFPEYSESYREVIYRSLLLEVCWCEVHSDPSSSRKGKSRIFECTSNSFPTLLHSSIPESYDREVAHPSDHIDFYFYEISTDTSKRRRKKFLHKYDKAVKSIHRGEEIIYKNHIVFLYSRKLLSGSWVLQRFFYIV